MSDADFSPTRGAPAEGGGSSGLTAVVVAHGQRLVDAPRPAGGYPLAWHVEAALVGDLQALAVAALRSSGKAPVSSGPGSA